MVGGMSRGNGDNLAARTARAQRPEQPTAPPDHGVKHVWVVDEHGRNPGLLHRWDRVASGWRGYVTHPIVVGDGWVLVDEWLPAEQLEPA